MDAVEEVKSRLSIEDVISEYVQLKRAGRNYKGISPFSNEKTPSFMVSPEKQIWHDFSSGKGGNIFSFVMEMEGLDFKGALELLARKANVDLTQFDSRRSAQTGQLKERLYTANELAAKFYQVQFSKNQSTLEYVFKKRQFSKETALEFKLGYSPNNGTALVDFLKKKGFTDKELQQAGLTARRYRGGVGDMFRGRLMIPLMDPQGRVIGFTARLLEDDPNAPKYINTPQTLLYDKSRHIFGLHLAKEAIRKAKYSVVVEGNLDVIASHQVGVRQVVATAGTAMTEMHLKALNRFAGDVRMAFDQDKAGQAATERSLPIASKVGVNLSIITIPEGKDPDELIKKDQKLWEKAIERHQPALDWLIERYQAQLDLETSAGKRQFSDVTLAVVRKLSDNVEQDHYVGKIAGIIGISKEALISKLKEVAHGTSSSLRRAKVEHKLDPIAVDHTKAQNQLLCLALMRPSLRPHLEMIAPEMLVADEARQLLKFLQENPDFKGDPKTLQSFFKNSQAVRSKSLHLDAAQGDAKQVEDKGMQTVAAQGAGEEAEQAVHGSTVSEHRSLQHSDVAGTSRGISAPGAEEAARVHSLEDYVKMLILHYEALYKDLEEVELEYEAIRLQVRLIEQYVKSQKARLALQMRDADDKTTHALLEEARALEQLLKKANEVHPPNVANQ